MATSADCRASRHHSAQPQYLTPTIGYRFDGDETNDDNIPVGTFLPPPSHPPRGTTKTPAPCLFIGVLSSLLDPFGLTVRLLPGLLLTYLGLTRWSIEIKSRVLLVFVGSNMLT